jgi:hypothetical protein
MNTDAGAEYIAQCIANTPEGNRVGFGAEYLTWIMAQTPERARAALDHLEICRRLGEVQRTAPYSEEAARLTAEVRKYYETFK